MNDEIFLSPSKRKEGVLNISVPRRGRTRRSEKQLVATVNRGILTATPKKNGRAGLISPAKRSNTDLDRSARKRAIKSNYEKLIDDELSDYDEDMSLADKIIEASKRDGGKPITFEFEGESQSEIESENDPFVDDWKPTPKKQQTGKIEDIVEPVLLPTREDFVPTPIPKQDSDFLLEKRFDDRALFLDGFEGYFEQHKTKVKTSGNTMAQLVSLEYEEYLRNIKLVEVIQSTGKQKLFETHRKMFRQWHYELLQGFNLCFYGTGSKRDMSIDFVQNFLLPRLQRTECCVINGYNTEVTLKEVLLTVLPILLPNHDKYKLHRNSRDLVSSLLRILPTNSRPFLDMEQEPKLILLINNIDGKILKEDEFQNVLSSLAQLSDVWIIATIDNVNAPLMWDSSKMSKYRFVWHDMTTFTNYNVENSFKDVLLLGKSSNVSGSKGAKYVLSSLTANAKSLYRILLSHQLANMVDDPDVLKKPELRGTLLGSLKHGLEFKTLYQLCLEEFVASNEVSFRTMLHEFIEHKMCNAVKDSSGTEMIFIPFKIDELEKLLEEELI